MTQNNLALVKDKLPDLAFLGTCNPKIRKYILENADKKLIDAIRECLHNLLKGNLPIKKNDMKTIKKHKKYIRMVASGNCFKKNKQILVQKGGFLSILLPTAVQLLTTLLTNKSNEK